MNELQTEPIPQAPHSSRLAEVIHERMRELARLHVESARLYQWPATLYDELRILLAQAHIESPTWREAEQAANRAYWKDVDADGPPGPVMCPTCGHEMRTVHTPAMRGQDGFYADAEEHDVCDHCAEDELALLASGHDRYGKGE